MANMFLEILWCFISPAQKQNLKQNYNIIVVAKDNITNAKFDELANEFRKLTKKAELIKNEESI